MQLSAAGQQQRAFNQQRHSQRQQRQHTQQHLRGRGAGTAQHFLPATRRARLLQQRIAAAVRCDADSHQQQRQQQQPQQQRSPPGSRVVAHTIATAAAAAALALSPMVLLPPGPAAAADSVKVGSCLLQKCQVQLAKCLGDPKCFQNIVCLNTCNAASTPEEEAACQIRCGDLYGDKAVDTFNACAVSDQKCVPQRADEGTYPVPPECALDKGFDLAGFSGRWYITAGLNPLFDVFDCQEHFFANPEPGRMVAKINWRINKPNGDFIDRSVVQTFRQTDNPSILYNGNNEYLHYEDTWYILGYKPDSYVVIYYRGKNDAWDGYGGATVYTKARQLPQELIPELSAAVEGAGLKWSDFKVTDNSCKPHPPAKSLVQEFEAEAMVIEGGLERGLRSFGRGFTVLEEEVGQELTREQAQLRRELRAELEQAEKILAKVERQVADEEKVLDSDLESVVSKFLSFFSAGSK